MENLRIDAVYRGHKKIPAWSEFVPILGMMIFNRHMEPVWDRMNLELEQRGSASFGYPIGSLESKVCEEVIKSACETCSWTTGNFDPNDEVGAAFWDPKDILSGVQGLMDLELLYQLPDLRLNWEHWDRKTMAELIETIVAESPIMGK